MKNKPEGRAAGVLQAFQRGKRDAEARRAMGTPYADREKQDAYERGFRWMRMHLHRQGSRT